MRTLTEGVNDTTAELKRLLWTKTKGAGGLKTHVVGLRGIGVLQRAGAGKTGRASLFNWQLRVAAEP